MAGPDVLTPQEIASHLCDAGVIDRATATLLEQRIAAYGESRAAQAREAGRAEGMIAAVQKAEAAFQRARGSQKAGAEKVLWAVRGVLPPEIAARREIARAKDQGYRRGYRDGKQSKTFTERNPRGAR